jgi:hypothetical protein
MWLFAACMAALSGLIASRLGPRTAAEPEPQVAPVELEVA